MESLVTVIKDSFLGYASSYSYGQRNVAHPITLERDLVVPVSATGVFELPTFLMRSFVPNTFLAEKEDFTLAVHLKSSNKFSKYKSQDAMIRDSMHSSFPEKMLQCIYENERNPDYNYYATHGAIFDGYFDPIMLLLWEIQAIQEENEPLKFKFIKPVMRVAPHVLTMKADSIQRYIINKIIPAALDVRYISGPSCSMFRNCTEYDDSNCRVKIVIEQMPLQLKEVATPSVSTTNEELLNIALDHAEEAVT